MNKKLNSMASQGKQNSETKQSIRDQIWQKMHKERLSPFPGPFGRIPNFKGAQEAAKKLLQLSQFQTAKTVEVNPDKPLEAVRALVLSNNKELYVPTPQLRGSLLKKLEKVNGYDIKRIVTHWGMNYLGKNINIDDNIKIDLIIVGCVAVSKSGYRIGKGKGFADLEFAALKEMGAINDSTAIVAVVHDIQIFDELDTHLFDVYDVPVDYIVTPTGIIKTKLNLPKPTGIYWNLISLKKLNDIETLQKLKAKQESEGYILTLKSEECDEGCENTEDNTSLNKRSSHKNNKKKNLFNNTTISDTIQEENKNLIKEQLKNENTETSAQTKRSSSHRSFNRKSNFRRDQFNAKASTSSESNNAPSERTKQHTKKEDIENVPPLNKQKKKFNGYSLIVSNIHKDVRIQDLKNALTEKGIKPNFITWRGYRGFCFLHYSKKNIKKDENGEIVPLAIDNVIEFIQDINVNPNPSQKLIVKVKEPITRIETLDVTSV